MNNIPDFASINERDCRNPFLTVDRNLDIAIGNITFKDNTIYNLRQQIENLRHGLKSVGVANSLVDELQYEHLQSCVNIAPIKPIVHFTGNPIFFNGRASVHAIDHPIMGDREVTTSLVTAVYANNTFETKNSKYVQVKR